jgi:hypothetical protein
VRETLAAKEKSAAMAREARRIAVEKYDYETVCLPQWRDFLGIK